MTPDPTERIRLLIVDDHPVVRDGLVAILHEGEPDLEVVGEAGDGKEAVVAWRNLRPTVTIMDLQLPGQTGVEAIKAIRREDPEARVLVLTTWVRRGANWPRRAYISELGRACAGSSLERSFSSAPSASRALDKPPECP